MSAGECIIDGTDIATLGMFIERDGSNDLLVFPSRRTPDTNDWFEEDGLEVDLSGVTFDAKKVVINYVMLADNYPQFKQRLNAFDALHNKPASRSIYIREYATTFTLRFQSFVNYEHRGGYYNQRRKIAKISVEYYMDNPLAMYTGAIGSPVGPDGIFAGVKINAVDLSKYGITVREVYSSALKPRSFKNILIRTAENYPGQVADDGKITGSLELYTPKRKAKEIQISCAMTSDTVNNLLININSLFAVLRSDVPLTFSHTSEQSLCYYTKMTSFRKETAFARKVYVSFTLHLQEISWEQLTRLLTTQSGKAVITQTGQHIILQ